MKDSYITYEEYIEMGGTILTSENADKYFRKASRQIDILTFGRINQIGWDNLTEYQKSIIKQSCFYQSDFIYENEELLDNILSSYAINGVSMSFNSNWNVTIENGVAMKTDNYKFLELTGLTCRSIYYWR